MFTNKLKFLAAVGVAGVVAASGSAFTAGNTVAASVAGYGTNEVTGAVATGVAHTLSGDGDTILSTVITFNASQQGRTVKAGFGLTDLENCTVSGTPYLTATCTYSSGYVTAAAEDFNVAVS